MDNVKIIGITGGSGSGKSTIVKKISEVCSDFAFIRQDDYYKRCGHVDNSNITAVNFDRPDALDMDMLYEHLLALKRGEAVDCPSYDFVNHDRREETVHIEPRPLVIVEGLMVLYDERIRSLLDLKIFVDTPADIRFIRRLQRDIKKRGRTMESVIKQYEEVVRPGHYSYIEPTKEYADIIVPEGGNNVRAMSVLIAYVSDHISKNAL